MVKKVKDRSGRFHNIGTVLREEVFGGFEQYVIDFGEEGIQRLRACDVDFIIPLEEQLYEGNYDLNDFILRVKASRLFNDDLDTGSLSRMRLDIIPHQIVMADKAKNTKTRGFLIADDVGLGKTVEAGLVMRSMIAHRRADRILLLCPANLAPQWREQLSERFDEWFDILKTEINIIDPKRWDNNPRVIASIQTLRLPKHREILLESSQGWDLVVVDEAHHLTAKEYGKKIDKTKNYQLLERLRERTRFFLFLTATPHQGEDDRFALLLKLLDPEIISSTDDLWTLGPKINDLMGRNIKAEVTDFEGNRLFKGHDMIRHEVTPSEGYSLFLEELKKFVSEGLASLDEKVGGRMRAENFVLTSFLKLASSSPEAIRRTLVRRHDNLEKGIPGEKMFKEHDHRYEGEYEENSTREAKELFKGEMDRIDTLLNKLGGVEDPKLTEVDTILEREGLYTDEDKRLLIFTEYRGTQDLVKEHLKDIFGKESVVLINGDMDTNQKKKAVKEFEMEKRFLVSTEAGGEGIDLHRNCHIMVNYDLPWNPMRLHQRTGRLDRYGQKERAHIHYIVVKGTIDDKIQRFLEEKIERIEESLGGLKGDRAENLREDILGQMTLSRDEISKLYLTDDGMAKERLVKNVEDAIEAVKRQETIFKEIKGFNLKEFKKIESDYTLGDLEELVRQYLISRHKRMIKKEDGVVHFEIPDEIKEMKVFHGRRLIRSRLRGVFDRGKADELAVDLLGTGNEYIDAMLDRLIKRADSGNVLASKVQVDENHPFLGKKGILAAYIVTSMPIAGGKPSFDGVEFVFYDPKEDRLYDMDEDIRGLLEPIGDERRHEIMSVKDMPKKDEISTIIEQIESSISTKIREGRIGSVNMSSLAWLEVCGGDA